VELVLHYSLSEFDVGTKLDEVLAAVKSAVEGVLALHGCALNGEVRGVLGTAGAAELGVGVRVAFGTGVPAGWDAPRGEKGAV
jgi:hypothetical protein